MQNRFSTNPHVQYWLDELMWQVSMDWAAAQKASALTRQLPNDHVSDALSTLCFRLKMSEFTNQSDICASYIPLSENRTGNNSSIVNEARVLRMWPIGAAANVVLVRQQQVYCSTSMFCTWTNSFVSVEKLLKSLQQSFLISN